MGKNQRFILVLDVPDNDFYKSLQVYCKTLLETCDRKSLEDLYKSGKMQEVLSKEFSLQCAITNLEWPGILSEEVLEERVNSISLSGVQWIGNYPTDGKEPSLRAIVDFYNSVFSIYSS